ncbi:protein of unknown function [Methylocaldum szegediense]|uniref:Uncharacterized protein n=1 Tax=Methylocaldum szegediense TaxID=73780 RepID=A0ABM9I2Y8_9GAMM|nr:protein of unknown function [Methylocaldum szegediense]
MGIYSKDWAGPEMNDLDFEQVFGE